MAVASEAPSSYSASTKTTSQLRTADDLVKKFDSLKRGRQLIENQWKLNLAFYKGRQYSYFNRASRRIESLPVEDGEKPRYRVRLVSNQIMTGAHSLLAKYIKTKPVMTATPGSGSQSDLKAAQMAERLLEHWWTSFSLDDKLEEVILWSIVAGQGFWKINWNPHAGTAMKFALDPYGKPIVDDAVRDLFSMQLAQQGIQLQEQVVYMGDIEVETMSPFNVYLDPTANTFDDCKYAICVHYLDPDEIYSRWKVEVDPDSHNQAPDTTLPFQNAADASDPTVKAVYIGYFKPQPALPNGRYVVWIDHPKKILEDGKWPYPTHELPLVKFPGIRVPGAIYDSSVVEHAIPLQKELNRTVSQIIEYKNLTIKPRYWAPVGSVVTRMTSEPGLLMEYNPLGDHKPEVEKLPTMPPYVFDHLTGIRNALREVFGIVDVTEGNVPPNVEAGIAIDLLQEMATDRLAPTIKLIEMALGRAGQLMLNLAQEYYVEPRLLKIKGSGGSTQVKRFTHADIQGGITVIVESGSGLPRTRAGRQARIERLIEMNVIPPDKAYKYLDVGDLKSIAAQFEADEDQALREHEKLMGGEIINEEEYNQVLTQLEQGALTDPNTGQPISNPQQAQQMLQNAGLKPLIYENYQTHMDTHALFMKSPEFDGLPLQVKEAFITHYTQTLQTFMSLPKPVEYQAVRPTLQIKTTAGPTAVSEILNKAGIFDLTPQEMTEPPLDTWVTDDLSKANVDASSNSKKDAVDAIQGMSNTVASQDAHAQDQARLDELHQAKVEEAHARVAKSVSDAQTHRIVAEAKAREALAKAHLAERTAREKRVNPPRPRSNGKK
jgi:hypothetical protein